MRIRNDESILKNLDNIIVDLKQLIEMTEDYYRTIHETLPIIERNLELTDQETEIIINYFIEAEKKTQSAEGDDRQLIAETISNIKKDFSKISKYLLNQAEINSMLDVLVADKGSVNSFDLFVNLIKEIEETLDEIGDISLNAIIFSSKLGAEGSGFSVVSDYIHQSSKTLEGEFKNITGNLDVLVKWHNNFKENIQGVINKQETVVSDYIDKLDQIFSAGVDSIQAISALLRDMMNNVKNVIVPFQDLMVFIQRQDIVRQNMENTIKCVVIIKSKYMELEQDLDLIDDKEQVLNQITFSSKASELVNKLAENMSEELMASINDINQTTMKLSEALEDVFDDARSLTAFFYDLEEENNEDKEINSMINFTFEKKYIHLNSFVKLLEEISSSVDNISKEKESFGFNFKCLGLSLNTVQQKVAELNKVKILAKIELSRLKLQDNVFGEKIDAVVKSVLQTISENNKAFKNLKISLQKDLEQFEKVIGANQTKINTAIPGVKNSVGELEMTNNIINQAVYALYKEIETLHNEVEKVQYTLNITSELEEKNQQIIDTICQAKESILTQETSILKNYGLNHWEENSEELHELFNYFTSYLERHTANEMIQNDAYDEGSEEGDLTLF